MNQNILYWICGVIFAIALYFLIDGWGVSSAADGGATVPINTVKQPPSECKDSLVWECRPCNRAGQIGYGGGCVCKFCVNSTGKTVEKDADLRGIYCMDRHT